ncbi:hypothetical protein JI666_20355 [Bacillus sp. NTK071]|uniref:hypothetical protein n=1 Tax=Bacillus sp. NTK071 TaxID=2802175 RepID=UPI001A8CA5F0|nr:hypothetical protein [Bacillus sp. NTK071]MBN8211091.1 hypothetical protein [Bacillus sp. NTK071]
MNLIDNTLEKAVARLICGEGTKAEKATAFLVSSNKAVTARHAIEDYYNQSKEIYLEFLNIDTEPVVRKATPYDISPIGSSPVSVLELEEEIILDTYLEFSDYQIEKDDKYETYGYPVVKWNVGERTNSYISRRIEREMTGFYDWDIDLKHDSKIETFRGLSGSPLIVNGRLVGVILAESVANGKAISLGAVSIEKITSLLQHLDIPIYTFTEEYELDEIYELDEGSDYSDAVFVAKLESASIYDHEDCQEEFFNADIAKSSIESRGFRPELKSLSNLRFSIKSIWKTEHRNYKEEVDGNELLKIVYKTVEQLSETTLKSDLPLSLIVKKGILHQLSDECKVGWVKNYKKRLNEFMEAKGQSND